MYFIFPHAMSSLFYLQWPQAAAMFKVLHRDPPIPETLSPEGKDFLQLCFRRNPAERPTANKLLEHSFIRNSHHYNLHGSIQAFAGINLVSHNFYSFEYKIFNSLSSEYLFIYFFSNFDRMPDTIQETEPHRKATHAWKGSSHLKGKLVAVTLPLWDSPN